MEIVLAVAALIAWALTARVAYLRGKAGARREWNQEIREWNAALIEELDNELS